MDNRALLAMACALTFLLSGCVDGTTPVEPDPGVGPRTLYADDNITVTEIIGAVGEQVAPSLETPPAWTVGTWWRVAMTDLHTGKEFELIRVVAGQEGDAYLVGMPTHDFHDHAVSLHLPGLGHVAKADLAFDQHDEDFAPLQFPVTEGATWDTRFMDRAVTVTVVQVDGLQAHMAFAGESSGRYTYDAARAAITNFEVDGYAKFDVIDHGTTFHRDLPEWEGQVTVPYGYELAFFTGRAGSFVTGPAQIGVAPPTEAIVLGPGYDRVSLVLQVGDIVESFTGGAVAGVGFYRETVTGPDGSVFQTEHLGPGQSIRSFRSDAPTGQWSFEHLAVGPGIAFAEGVGYRVFDVQLPDGNLIETTSEHAHEEGDDTHAQA